MVTEMQRGENRNIQVQMCVCVFCKSAMQNRFVEQMEVSKRLFLSFHFVLFRFKGQYRILYAARFAIVWNNNRLNRRVRYDRRLNAQLQVSKLCNCMHKCMKAAINDMVRMKNGEEMVVVDEYGWYSKSRRRKWMNSILSSTCTDITLMGLV